MSRSHLLAHLRTYTADDLGQAIFRFGPVLRYFGKPQSLDRFAQIVLARETVQTMLGGLTLPQRQVLAGVARCAKADQPADPRDGASSEPSQWHGTWMMHARTATADTAEVIAAFGASAAGPIRDLVLPTIETLNRHLLLWPIGPLDRSGLPQRLGIAASAVEILAVLRATARSADGAMTACFNKPEVARIAMRLGVGDQAEARNTLQAAIVRFLADGERVALLIAMAPPGAEKLLAKVAVTGGRMLSDVFQPVYGYGGKWTVNPSYGDQDTVWLAEHGLVMPAGRELVEIPQEVLPVLNGGTRFPLTAKPATVATRAVEPAQVAAGAAVAVGSALRKVNRMLEEFNATPGIVRKTGGLAVRETRRLGKLLGIDAEEVRFWLDLCAATGLVDVVDGASPVACLTAAYDAWLELPPAQRFERLLRTWLNLDALLTRTDEPGQTPVALFIVPEPHVKAMRHAYLAALSATPPGQGCPVDTKALKTFELTEEEAKCLSELSEAAAWHAPMPFDALEDAPVNLLYTIFEAELLGLVAHGAPTTICHAVVPPGSGVAQALAALLPQEVSTARFQADLTAIVAGMPVATTSTLLDSVAIRESEGHAVVWRMSAATVRRALNAGRDAADLLADLRGIAEAGLPQPIEYLINDVARAHGRMRVVRSACCIRSDDESLLTELEKTKALAKLGLRRIAPTVVISVKSPAETLAALRAAGYSPVLEAETGTTIVEREIGRRAPKPRQRRPEHELLTGITEETARTTAITLLAQG